MSLLCPSDFIFILSGVGTTLKYVIISLSIGFCLGLGIALVKTSGKKLLVRAADTYTAFFRGTPLIVQLSLVYFGIPQIFHFQITAFLAGIFAFSLNSSAYLSEVIRAAIESIDPGQLEAARVLRISPFYAIKDVILPQALRRALPSLANESISLLKDTALISIIGEEDLMRRSQLIAAEKYTYFAPLLVAAAGYFVLIFIISRFFRMMEGSFSWSK